jgi:hypothetical protein
MLLPYFFSCSVVLILGTFLMMDLVQPAKDTASIQHPCLSRLQTAVGQKEAAEPAAQFQQTEQRYRVKGHNGNKVYLMHSLLKKTKTKSFVLIDIFFQKV